MSVGTDQWVSTLTIDQMRYACETMGEKIKAIEDAPKRTVWRVYRGGLCEANYREDDAVWAAVYAQAPQELKDAMDLAYLTGQRPADVIAMNEGDVEGDYLTVQQGKTGRRLRILMQVDGIKNSLGMLIEDICTRNKQHSSARFILNTSGRQVSQEMLRNRWDDAREKARLKAIVEGNPSDAEKIAQFQFKDIRPKAASEITDIGDASLLLGHSKQEITKRVYRRVGAIAKPSK